MNSGGIVRRIRFLAVSYTHLPWSVRMAESEMVRCPESWQLDFQTRLKWDYCHGLELQAMLDVYCLLYTSINLRNRIVAAEYGGQFHNQSDFTRNLLAQINPEVMNERKLRGKFWEQRCV